MNTILAELPRENTTAQEYQESFLEIMEEYEAWEKIYTDGSMSEKGVGATAVWRRGIRKATLPKEASIFTAELYAIHMAKTVINENAERKFIIITDSLSVLQRLATLQYKDTMARQLQHELYSIGRREQLVELMWVPGHMGVGRNETADKAAKEAASGIETLISIPYTD